MMARVNHHRRLTPSAYRASLVVKALLTLPVAMMAADNRNDIA